MTEIKPVYQRRIQDDDWQEIEHSEYVEFSERGKFQTRILYHAAAYEALQKENAELKATISNLTKAYERESNDGLKALEERDYWYNKADSLADKISECFDVPIGEHSNVNCPIVEAMKILTGEYVTKFDRETAAQANRIAELEAAVKANHEWHQEHDDYDGYQESEIFTVNTNALSAQKGN